jgi:hypothetical protein
MSTTFLTHQNKLEIFVRTKIFSIDLSTKTKLSTILTSSVAPTSPASSVPIAAVAGAAAGGIILVILVVIAAIFFLKRRKRRNILNDVTLSAPAENGTYGFITADPEQQGGGGAAGMMRFQDIQLKVRSTAL